MTDNPIAYVNFPDRAALLDDLTTRMVARTGFTVATINLDHIVKMRSDPAFEAAYGRHSHIVADGNPIVWLAKLAGRKVDLIPGSELIAPLVAIAADKGVPIALLGSTEATLDLTARRLQDQHPTLKIVAKIAPAFGFDPQGDAAAAALREIDQSGAGLCFLALGAPKQEMLAIRGADLAPGCGFVSIGAGLDFIAGHQTRAPVWVRKLALEWFWRMMTNPKRLAKRYALCAAVLPGLALASWRKPQSAQPDT
ncbi:WecB/TagA/CpsF family glycosyltransferase [Yoonia sp. SS1-5]|uniref:WecB/TagA/CpsF family glycosyltransferase n=1 Tax=Yoonia rhodophyticola TaxID=3137370 RepID=A0AAN0MFQ7_9RHOB